MNFVQHKSNNAVLGAPQGWDQKALPCGALPVTRVELEGVPAVISFWVPDKAELEALNKGCPVQLRVYGFTHPPVMVAVSQEPLCPVQPS